MKLPHLPLLSILRTAVVSLSWCLFESTSHAQIGALDDKPYVPSASVVKGTVAALSDSSEEVVALAVRALADWRQASAAEDIAKLLSAETPEAVRVEAFKYFARLGKQAKPHVAAALKYAADPDPNIRAAVLDVVFQAEASAEYVGAIRPLLDDPRGDVRAAAAKCLGQAGKAAAAHHQALLDAIKNSGSTEVKVAALRALLPIGGLEFADLEIITPLERDRDAEVRIAACSLALNLVTALQASGTAPAEKLAAARKELSAQFESEAPEVKTAMIGEAGKDKATAEANIARLVSNIRTGTPELKAGALRVLGNAGEAALPQVPLVVEQAKDADSIVRAAAIASLGSMGAAAVKPNVAIVANGLLDASDTVRSEALLALPVCGDALRNLPFKVRDVYPAASPAVRSTLIKAMPIIARIAGVDDEAISRGRASLTDPNPDLRIAMAFVMSELGAKDGSALLPELLALVKDPDAAVRGAAAVSLRAFVTDAASKQKFREALRPLLKDRDAEVRWAALDTFHELDPAQDPALVAEIAALLKDEEQPVRSAAARALGAAGAAAKPHLLDVVRFFNDDPAVPPYAAAEAIAQISPLTSQELTSLLYPLYVSADLQPLMRLTAYEASGGDPDGVLIIRLLGRSGAAAKDVVTPADKARATALLQDALKAPLLHDKLKAEITARLAEVKATQ